MLCADLMLQHAAAAETGDDVPTHELIRQRYGEDRAAFVKVDVCLSDEVRGCVEEAVRMGGGRLDV